MKGSANFIYLLIYLSAQMEKSKEVQFSTSHKSKQICNTSFAKLSFKTNSHFPFSFLFFFSLSL
jgi:hypothetical protein